MSTATEKAADLADMIAENPVTVTAYRRAPGGIQESTVGEFQARIDQTAVRMAMESVSRVGAYTRQNYVMTYVTSHPDVQHGDEVWAEYDDGRSFTFRVLGFHDHGWKKEAIMEKIG